MRLLMVILCGCLLTIHAFAQEAKLAVDVIRDIPYTDDDDFDARRHILDLYIPEGVDDYPILVFVHGGAWVGGSKDGLRNVGDTLAANGIGVVIVNYRLSPRVTHPAHAEDIARAVAWVEANIADYGGDPNKLVIGGHSAGGHLTSLLVLDPQYLSAVDVKSDVIKGVLSVSGVYWIDDWIVQWARGAFPDDEAGREAASPYYLVRELSANETMPPFMLMITENDYPELIVESEAMWDRLIEAGFMVEYSVIQGRDHYSVIDRIGRDNDRTAPIIVEWLAGLFTES